MTVSAERIKCNKTDRVETTLVILYGPMNLAPLNMHFAPRVFDIQGNVRGAGENGGCPRSDQSTPRDENKLFHSLYAQSLSLCAVKPGTHVVSDVVLERLGMDNISAVTILRKI